MLGPAAEGGLVVAGAVLVQAGGCVEVAAGVPEGVGGGQGGVGSAGAGGVAVRVVGVGDGDPAGGVDQAEDRARRDSINRRLQAQRRPVNDYRTEALFGASATTIALAHTPGTR